VAISYSLPVIRVSASLTVLLVALAPAGCAGPGASGRSSSTGGQDQTRYVALCEVRGVHQGDAERKQHYLPARYRADRVDGAPPAVPVSDFEDVVATVTGGRARRIAITGRGGLGKTRAAAVLEARLCTSRPVLRLEVRTQIIPALNRSDRASGEALVSALEQPTPGAERGIQGLSALLDNEPWILLVDSLDEAPVVVRTRILSALDDLLDRYPRGKAVVHTRAPLVQGLTVLSRFETVIEMLPVTCRAADARLRSLIPDPAKLTRFLSVAAAAGLLRKTQAFGQCSYPHLATWRDLEVAVAVLSTVPALPVGTRAALYKARVGQLLAGLAGLDTAQAVQVVQRMVSSSSSGHRDFTARDCVVHLDAALAQDGPAPCAALLQSPLFRFNPREGTYRLIDESVVDYFVARGLNRRLGEAGTCAPLMPLIGHVELGEVAAFLLGMPAGAGCAGTLTNAVCEQLEDPEHIRLLLDQGLPAGPARSEILPPPGEAPCHRGLVLELEEGLTFEAP
jgi:hypothetical protein